jgi:transaldolase
VTVSCGQVLWRLYLDTANVKEIQETVSLGVLDGVTTNPSFVAKEGRSFHETLVEICHLVDGPVSAEVVSAEQSAMVTEGKELAKIHENIVRQGPVDSRRAQGNKTVNCGRNQGERHPVLFSKSGVLGCQGWSLVYLSVYRPIRRY